MARPRVHDDAVRTRLLEVASELVATGGPTALTLRDAARRAGTSASAVYTLFGSRASLLTAIREEAFSRFGAHLAGVPVTADPRADLLELGLAYRRSALADPHFYRVMFSRSGAPLDEAVVERATFIVLRDAVARVLPPGAPPDDVALALWAQVHGLVSLELAGLLPGTSAERGDRYERTLRAAGAGLLAMGSGTGTGTPTGAGTR